MIPNIKIEIKLESIVENNELKNQRKWTNFWEINMNYVYLSTFIIKLTSLFMKTFKNKIEF
jgi:hypothetical protein